MSVPSPATLAVGDLLTAAIWNLEVRDSINYLLSPPHVRVIDTAGVNQPTSGTAALVTWDTNNFIDPSSMHSTSTNPSRLIAPYDGVYLINVFLRWVTNGTGTRQLNLRKNSAGSIAGGTSIQISTSATLAANQPSVTVSLSQQFVAGDYIEAFATQTSGGALALAAGGSFFELIFTRKP